MRKIWILLVALAFSSCKESPSQPPQPASRITAYVHWENQGVANIHVELVQTGETKLTDSTGTAEFSVPAGKYVVRASGIQGPGPALRTLDFDVVAQSGQTAKVDIEDCLPCL